jgi:two-component system, cell cycle sensor histidine kinase and response regulator CckA
VASITKMLESILGEDIHLRADYGFKIPSVKANSGMVEQVLMNLAVNSRDAMKQGGTLNIGTSMRKAQRPDGNANTTAMEDFVVLTVKDSGCGIAAENLSKIFDPFFTTKGVNEGTGLGLATAYAIVQQHNGWITVDSEVNKGTTFNIFLPPSLQEANPPYRSETRVARGGAETILLVEDDQSVRDMTKIILESYGYCVLSAASGQEALRIWESSRDKIDLVFTDMVMPDHMTGPDLINHLSNEKSDLKYIFTSGYSGEIVGQRLQQLKEGFNFLQKPYHPAGLARAIRQRLDLPAS